MNAVVACRFCGEGFQATHRNAKYCSQKCGDLYSARSRFGLRFCDCGNTFIPQLASVAFCSQECYVRSTLTSRDCRICRQPFTGRGEGAGAQKYCSDVCARIGKGITDGKHSSRWRRQIRDTDDGTVDVVEILHRDLCICQICGDEVDMTVPWPDPKSFSLDHKVALSRGGRHTFDNVRVSHLGCNILKGASE